MSKKILIIDVDMHDIQRISEHVKQYAIEPLVATSSQKGIQIFFDEYPDMVLVNLLMPDLPGTEVVKRLKSRTEGNKIPIYFISQLASSGSTLAAEAKIQGLFAKPVDLIELDKALQTHFKDMGKAKNLANAGEPTRIESSKSVGRKAELPVAPFPKVLAHIFKNQMTGVLAVNHPAGAVKIKFSKGEPIAFVPLQFAKFLLRQGHLDSDEAKQIPKIAKEEKISGKEALKRLGKFRKSQVASLFRAFAYDLAGMLSDKPKSEATFFEKLERGKPVTNTVELVWQGVRRHYDPERLTKIFEKDDRNSKKLYITKEAPDISKLHSSLSWVIRSINGKSIRQLSKDPEAPSNIELMQMTYAMLLCGMLSFSPDEASEPAPTKTQKGEQISDKSTDTVLAMFDSIPDDLPLDPTPAPKAMEPPAPIPAEPPMPNPEPVEVSEPQPQRMPVVDSEPTLTMVDSSEDLNTPDDDEQQDTGRDRASVSNKELFKAGARFMESGYYSKAQACYEELISRGLERPEVLVNLGLAQYHNRFNSHPRRRMLEVAWVMKRAQALDEKYIPAYLTFGKILERDGKPQLAYDQYRAALTVDPENVKAHAALKRLNRNIS